MAGVAKSLVKHEDQQSDNYVYFEAKPEGSERTDGYYMTLDQWIEMGTPQTIIVQVFTPGTEPSGSIEGEAL